MKLWLDKLRDTGNVRIWNCGDILTENEVVFRLHKFTDAMNKMGISVDDFSTSLNRLKYAGKRDQT